MRGDRQRSTRRAAASSGAGRGRARRLRAGGRELPVSAPPPLNLLELEEAAAEAARSRRPRLLPLGSGRGADPGPQPRGVRRRSSCCRACSSTSRRSTRLTTVLGTALPHPVVVAPTAFHRLADPEGEVATARGAAAAGALMCLSSLSNTPMEDVAAAAAGAPRWFQLYVFRDRGVTRDLVARAEAAGYGAIVLTVDAPVLGRRERDVRNEFELPRGADDRLRARGRRSTRADRASPGWPPTSRRCSTPRSTGATSSGSPPAPACPVVVKGVHRPDDAERAIDAGAAGVDRLQPWRPPARHRAGDDRDAARRSSRPSADRADVLLDGGVRRGTDVIKALALGARAVLIGRPVLWGLAIGGAGGVEATIRMLVAETRRGDDALRRSNRRGSGSELLG